MNIKEGIPAALDNPVLQFLRGLNFHLEIH